MFRADITLAVESGDNTLTTTTKCTERAYRAEHQLNQLKEIRAKKFESKGKSSKSFGRSKTHRVKQFYQDPPLHYLPITTFRNYFLIISFP